MRNCIYILLHLALYLRRRRIYVTEEAFGCVQYFADGVNEGSSITFCKKCAVALRSCLPRQGNERTASTSFSSQSILRCRILYSAHYWPREMQIWVSTANYQYSIGAVDCVASHWIELGFILATRRGRTRCGALRMRFHVHKSSQAPRGAASRRVARQCDVL